jgi:MFS family permease
VAAAVGFVVVEGRVAAPLVDLRLLRNLALVGSTLAILIGAGAIAALGLLMSLYFQDPAGLGMSSLAAGLASLPVAALVILVAPAITPLTSRFGTRPIISAGFLLLTGGFAVLVLVQPGWTYATFVLPLLAIAVGLGLSNGPASAISTSCVSPADVGAASGISNMARYVGGAVMTAVAAGIYGNVGAGRLEAGESAPEALASGFGAASLALAIFSGFGIVLAVLARRRARRAPAIVEYAAAAAATTHTVPVQEAVAAGTGSPVR